MKKHSTKKRRVRAPRRGITVGLTPAGDTALVTFRASVRRMDELLHDCDLEYSERLRSLKFALQRVEITATNLFSVFVCDNPEI